jgi:hypothetical protein
MVYQPRWPVWQPMAKFNHPCHPRETCTVRATDYHSLPDRTDNDAAGRGDEMVHCNSDVQKTVFDSILTEKEFYEVEGGHYGCLYAGTDLFDEAVAAEIAFIKRHSAPRS